MSKENKSRYALLGMLSICPMSGYDLKKLIERSIGYFWNESYPQIYPMLRQLEEEGLTTSRMEGQEGRPDRRVYSLTEPGREVLRQWLREPFEYQVERNELLLKLFFGNLVPTSISVEQVRQHRERLLQSLQAYEEIEGMIKGMESDPSPRPGRDEDGRPRASGPYPPEGGPFWLATLSYGRHMVRAQLDWCDETLRMLEGMASVEEGQNGPISQ